MSNQNIYYSQTQVTQMHHLSTHRFTLIIPILISFIFFIPQICCTITQAITLAPSSRGNNYTIDISTTGATDILKIKLVSLTGNPLPTTGMIVSLNQPMAATSVELSSFYHKQPFDVKSAYDLDAMWESRDQRVNILRNSQPNLYVTIVNFDPSYRTATSTYSLTVDNSPSSSPSDCQTCQNGGTPQYHCFCKDCMYQFTGKICSRVVVDIQKNITMGISPYKFQFFSISNTDKITVEITVSGGVAEVYFQFEQFSGEVASFYNVAKGTSDGRYIVNNNVLKIGADTQQRKLLITLVSFASVPINASINYTVESTVSVLVIVMSVLGGILLIALIVAIVCIIKRRNSGRTRVESQLNIPSDTNKLSAEQIQRYFPVCIFSEVSNPAENTTHPMVSGNLKQGETDQQCIICLEQIKYSDQIRMGYCKHMYHGQCLTSWFKKQRNCPMCRKEWTRDDTAAEYNKLVTENGNVVLRGTELVKAIFNRKLTVSKTVIQNME